MKKFFHRRATASASTSTSAPNSSSSTASSSSSSLRFLKKSSHPAAPPSGSSGSSTTSRSSDSQNQHRHGPGAVDNGSKKHGVSSLATTTPTGTAATTSPMATNTPTSGGSSPKPKHKGSLLARMTSKSITDEDAHFQLQAYLSADKDASQREALQHLLDIVAMNSSALETQEVPNALPAALPGLPSSSPSSSSSSSPPALPSSTTDSSKLTVESSNRRKSHIAGKERETLLRVCCQRVCSRLKKQIDEFTAAHLRGESMGCVFCAESELIEEHAELQVINVLLRHITVDQIHILVSERLPSTLVKVIKAQIANGMLPLRSNTSATIASASIIETTSGTGCCHEVHAIVYALTKKMIPFEQVVVELMDSDTLHRLFHLNCSSVGDQQAILSVIERFVQEGITSKSTSRPLFCYLVEHKCLLGITNIIRDDCLVLAQAISVTNQVLRKSSEALIRSAAGNGNGSVLELHEQLRKNHQYRQFLAAFVRVFERSVDRLAESADVVDGEASASTSGTPTHGKLLQDQERILVALEELCNSKSDSPFPRKVIEEDKAFTRVLEESSDSKMLASCHLNEEAFDLFVQIMEFLHVETKAERVSSIASPQNDPVAKRVRRFRRQLECNFVRKFGRILVFHPFHYALAKKMTVLEGLIRRIDEYSDETKHTLSSVLSALAIEANVIPYTEVEAINKYFRNTNSAMNSTSVEVLVGFLSNLLRFNDMYRKVLRQMGLLQALIDIFCLLSNQSLAGQVQISVASAGSNAGGGSNEETSVHIREGQIAAFLHARCHPEVPSLVKRPSAMQDTRLVVTFDDVGSDVQERLLNKLIEALTLFACDGCTNAEEVEELRVFCGTGLLDCLTALTTDKRYQEPALSLWIAVLRIALVLKKQNSNLINVINCLVQAIRVSCRTIYSRDDTSSPADKPSMAVLRKMLACLEEIVRPCRSNRKIVLTQEDPSVKKRHSIVRAQYLTYPIDKQERERIFATVIECDVLMALLGVLLVIPRCVHAVTSSEDDKDHCKHFDHEGFETIAYVIRLLHAIVAPNAVLGHLLVQRVTFGFLGDLIVKASARLMEATPSVELARTAAESKQEETRPPSPSPPSSPTLGAQSMSTGQLYSAPLRLMTGWCLEEYFYFEHEDAFVTLVAMLRGSTTSSVASDWNSSKSNLSETSPPDIIHPGAFLVMLQLLSLWSERLPAQTVGSVVELSSLLMNSAKNARALADLEAVEVLLRSFASTTPRPSSLAVVAPAKPLNQSLLDSGHEHNQAMWKIVQQVAEQKLSHREVCQWLKLILLPSSGLGDRRATTLSASSVACLRRLVQFGWRSFQHLHRCPCITFEVLSEGFAYLQIPDVLAKTGSQSNQGGHNTANTSSSAYTAKSWPPSDGYTVMLWFRIDQLERKDDRDEYYRQMDRVSRCVLCLGQIKDEFVLKCSHRACRGCHEALLNYGGECTVCNPPMFLLFRFRSSDGKSITEVFVKGAKLFMRTNGSRTLHQFSHAPLEHGQWYHAAFSHSRQRFQSSVVSFFLNGLLQENAKISFPANAAIGQPVSGLIGISSQARRKSKACWTIGPFYLLEDSLNAAAINAVYAIGPWYDGLFFGALGNGDIQVSLDHLGIENLVLLDEFLHDPIRSLIQSVDAAAERVARSSSLIRAAGSISLSSATSSALTAAVAEFRSNLANVNGGGLRSQTGLLFVNMPFTLEKILVAYSSSNALSLDSSVIPCSKHDGKPIAQLMGGAVACSSPGISKLIQEMCSSGTRLAYLLVEQAQTTAELALALEFLRFVLRSEPRNLEAMENERGYGIINYLLHEKASLLNSKCLTILFQIVGIDTDSGCSRQQTPSDEGDIAAAGSPDNAIRNLLALQHFVLDYALWQKVDTETQSLLFSTLYSCLVTGEEALRERNRGFLQTLSIVKQLLYVFLDPNVSNEILRVIVDLVLVCLTMDKKSDTSGALESNFADVASFLVTTLSPKFSRHSDQFLGASGGAAALLSASSKNEAAERAPSNDLSTELGGSVSTRGTSSAMGSIHLVTSQSSIGKLCLSPRGREWRQQNPSFRHQRAISNATGNTTFASLWPSSQSSTPSEERRRGSSGGCSTREAIGGRRARQIKVQELLLDILLKAVQKHDLKASKEKEESQDALLEGRSHRSDSNASVTAATPPIVPSSNASTTSRVQLPTSSKLMGFRKLLSPRWITYFLVPSLSSIALAPTTIILALRLLGALLSQPRYEALFKKEGFYRLLAQGLPCKITHGPTANGAMNATASASPTAPKEWAFPFHELWYALLCMVLGTPIGGIPHEIRFEMFDLCKDFELNIQNDQLVNSSVLWVIIALVRRHYDDPLEMARLVKRHRALNTGGNLKMVFAAQEQVRSLNFQTRFTPREALHVEVIQFLQHLYKQMPSFQRLLMHGSGNSVVGNTTGDKFRMEFIHELCQLVCACARARLIEQYAPSERKILQRVLAQHKEITVMDFWLCTIDIVEGCAAKDDTGKDPFQDGGMAYACLSFLVVILLDLLVDSSRGFEIVEMVFDYEAGLSLVPPLHEGLQIRFQSVLCGEILDGLQAKCQQQDFSLEARKVFAINLGLFCRLVVKKMHMWQRAQHGDACPAAFLCCGGDRFHFTGGALRFLRFVLFILAETAVGVSHGNKTAGSGGSLSDKSSTKGKKRRQLRQMFSRFTLSRSAELDQLTTELFAGLNATILHMIHGHHVEVNDEELTEMLDLIHSHREVVLGSRNGQDKDFFICMCRFLLQLVLDDSNMKLQHIATHIWIDLMYLQRPFIVELLTIEIRRSGAPPYSMNLMKSGFDVLLECAKAVRSSGNNTSSEASSTSGGARQGSTSSVSFSSASSGSSLASSDGTLLVQTPAFGKFRKWLELLGPPLKELEIMLDKVFFAKAMELKERVRDGWSNYHKRSAQRKTKLARRFASRVEWMWSFDKNQIEMLSLMQQNEFQRQLRWKQDRVDRKKFIIRQWQLVKATLLQQALGIGVRMRSEHEQEEQGESKVKRLVYGHQSMLTKIYDQSEIQFYDDCAAQREGQDVWRLDFTEGPYRMRKRLCQFKSYRPPEDLKHGAQASPKASKPGSSTAKESKDKLSLDVSKYAEPYQRLQSSDGSPDDGQSAHQNPLVSPTPRHPRRRRFSDSDLPYLMDEEENQNVDESLCDLIVFSGLQHSEQQSGNSTSQLTASSTTVAALSSSAAPVGRPHVSKRSSLGDLRRGSFETFFRRNRKESSSSVDHSVASLSRVDIVKRDSFSMTGQESGNEDDEDDEDENQAASMGVFGNLASEEEVIDEKLRPLLVPGDEVMDIYDCLRVDGMDSCPGVFLLCTDHLYIVDNYQRVIQEATGFRASNDTLLHTSASKASHHHHHGGGLSNAEIKVVEVPEETMSRMERRMSYQYLTSPNYQSTGARNGVTSTGEASTSSSDSLSNSRQCRYWSYDDITELHKRRHHLRHVALEIFFHDGRNYLITFESIEQRENVFHSLLAKCPNVKGAANGLDRTALAGDLYSQLRKLLRNNMTERWVAGEISNFEYLMHLNTLAGRTYNDLTQYPVFPWILSDYTSSNLDLNDPRVFRDLSKPMGALHREEEFRARYESLLESYDPNDSLSSKPFHYGTHYSTSGIVLHYLLRMEPFTSHFLHLQGGRFDHADRLFGSIHSAWKSAAGLDSAQSTTQDVKELIPEFFYLPAFLENVNHLDFGKDQNGVQVDHVELPPWAKGSAREFVRLHRQALESDFVSANLHHWIDLIFGFKQQGEAAEQACNVFYHLTYEGAVDLDKVSDVATRKALIHQINEFGQTPSQLFKTPHPVRCVFGGTSAAIGGTNANAQANAGTGGATTSPVQAQAANGGPSTHAGSLLSGVRDGNDLLNRVQTFIGNATGERHTPIRNDKTGTPDDLAIIPPIPATVVTNLRSLLLQFASNLVQEVQRKEFALNATVVSNRLHFYGGGSGTARKGYSSSSRSSHSSAMSRARHRAIRQVGLASMGGLVKEDKLVLVGEQCHLIPPKNAEFFAWGNVDRSLKVFSVGANESRGISLQANGLGSGSLQVAASAATSSMTTNGSESSSASNPLIAGDTKCLASFAIDFGIQVLCTSSDGKMVVAGGSTCASIRVWSFTSKNKTSTSLFHKRSGGSLTTRFALTNVATLATPLHQRFIQAIQVSRWYSIVVSVCASGIICLWDLNRMRWLRTLPSVAPDALDEGFPLDSHAPNCCVAINDVSGDIVISWRQFLAVYDVNGELLVRLDGCQMAVAPLKVDAPGAAGVVVSSRADQNVVSCLCLSENAKTDWLAEKMFVTGYTDGSLGIWCYTFRDAQWRLEQHARYAAKESKSSSSSSSSMVSGGGVGRAGAVTAVYLPNDEKRLYSATSDGLLSIWSPT